MGTVIGGVLYGEGGKKSMNIQPSSNNKEKRTVATDLFSYCERRKKGGEMT